LYAVPGTQTCAQQYFDYHGLDLGSLNHERDDAQAFAEWGVDYLKYDWCRAHINDGLSAPEAFKKMADELAAVAPHIVYSISEYGLFESHLWAPEFANLWRTTDDLLPHWNSVMRTLDQQVELHPYSKPGHWNDPDMLQVGNGTLTKAENRSHMFLWAILNAPLMAGNDLTRMSDEVLDLLKHPGVIAIDQDWGGSQGQLVHDLDGVQIWQKPMSTGGVAGVLLNRNDSVEHFDLLAKYSEFDSVVDVWSGESIDGASVGLDAHDSIMFTAK
jgi:alpha-galactosidase